MYRLPVIRTCSNCRVVKEHDICINCGYAPGIGYLPIAKVRAAYDYEEKDPNRTETEALCRAMRKL